MKLYRIVASLTLLMVLAGVAYVSQLAEPTGIKITNAADKFLGALTAEQKAKATFAFDDKERTNSYFVPREKDKKPIRKGLRLEEMTAAQKQAALELLRASISETGYTQATTIMSLEGILKDLEKGSGPTRNTEWYFFSIFGTPSKTGKWGCASKGITSRLNFTLDKGKVISSTPAVFGANPATVKDGPRQGLRTLTEAEDLARELFKVLTEDQRKVAYQTEQFKEIQQATVKQDVGAPKGLPAGKMTDKQRTMLVKLIHSYANRQAPDVAQALISRVNEAGIDKVHFAWAGAVEPGKPHSYRIQGPTDVIQFLNVQADSAKNPANHIHSSWSNLQGDFGLVGK